MSACTKHAAKPVRGYSDCPGCEVENLRQQLAAAQAKAQKLRAEVQVLRERSAHVSRMAIRLAIEKDQLTQALAQVRELPAKWRAAPQDPDEPLLAMAADELDAALSQPTEQHDPLAVSDHCPECGEPEPECACDERDTCTNCGGTGVGGYHIHAPQEDAVEALRCEACDGSGPIEHELPLMARREWMFTGARYAFRDCDSVWFQSIHKPGRVWKFCYRIADTDENGFPVIERTTNMPEGAKYRITLGSGRVIYQNAPKGVGFVGFVDTTRCERIEDYRESE